MTRTIWSATTLLLATTTLAQAGALDRTLQPVGILFEEGNYAELSFGFTSPDVNGTAFSPLTGGDTGSGNAAVDFRAVSLSFKYDLSDRISLGLIVDQPFGADIDYDESDAGYLIAGSSADFRSTGVTVLGRYKFNDAFSVHGGLRYVAIDADLFVASYALVGPPVVPVPTLVPISYEAEYDEDSDVGYVVGGAYERPDIALRVALTYSSETEFNNSVSYLSSVDPATSGDVSYTMPQSINLDFRTGIAADTLLFGSLRWADWSETEIVTPGYFANPVVGYENDVYTTTLGIGRKLTDAFSASAAVIYETKASSDFDAADPDNSGASNLSPTDGQVGIQLAGTYLMGNGIEFSGGVRYTRLGDATTRTIGADFTDNEAVSVGLRVGYRF